MKKIGIFDSGIGGLSIASKIRNINLDKEIVYIADSAFFPYGSKNEKIIIDRSCDIVQKLIDKDCDIIIVACNTASSAALEILRKNYSVPIIGIEPAVKPAIQNSQSGKLLLLATSLTTSGNRLSRLEKNYIKDEKLFSLPMDGLAEQIERANISKEEIILQLKMVLNEYYGLGVDSLILGCTHYYFLKDILADISPKNISIFDSIDGVVNRLMQILPEQLSQENSSRDEDFELIDYEPHPHIKGKVAV